jgi:CrcB protein
VPEHAPHPPTRQVRPGAAFLTAVAAGGATGGYLRVGLSLLPFTGSSGSWPWITFCVNVAGTFVLALTVGLLGCRGRTGRLLLPLIGVGFCGALTTFSTLQLEVFRMLRAGEAALAAGYLSASLLAGAGAIYAGHALGAGDGT